MKMNIRRIVAVLALVILLAPFILVPIEASAENLFYGDYTDVTKIYDYGSCPSMQGLAVGSQKLYTIKIDGSDYYSFISMTDKDSGETVKLYNSDAGSYYFTYMMHANDMDVWGIDDYSNLFITTTEKGSEAIVRLKRVGNTLTKVASYELVCNGSQICSTALAVKSVSNGQINFISKWGMQLYEGSVSTSATSATIEMRETCTITKSRVYIKGEYLDLSNFVNQGFGYYDGTLFVPITGDDSQLNRSVIMVFDLNNAEEGTTVYPTEALVFRVTSSAYSALCEIESCDICPTDGKLYFNHNRRVTSSDTNHDGVSSFDTYTYSRLPVDAPTSKPDTKTYTVHYNANGGTGTMADTVVNYGISTKLRTNAFTRNGFDFAGWTAHRMTQDQWYYTDGSSTGWYAEGSQPSGYYLYTYNDGQSVSATSAVDGDIVNMYAQWTPKAQTYTVRYDANGGTGTMEDTTVVYGYTTNLRKNTFTKTGHKFVGWNAYRTAKNQWYYTDGTDTGWYTEGSQPSGWYLETYNDGVGVAKTTSTADDVCIFYAVWEPITYTVQYNANGGTGTMTDSTVTYGVSTILKTNAFTRSGYDFTGWNAYRTSDSKWYYTNGTSSDWYAEGSQPSGYTKSLYKDGASVSKTTNVDGDVCVFYAQWKSNNCTVTFKNADGTVLKTESVAYGAVPTAPANPTKSYDTGYHYTFSGWDKALTAVTADTTYTAQYTAVAHSYTVKVTQAPSCTSTGTQTYTCTCGYSYTESIAASAHNYESVVTAPTCTAKGYTTNTCTVCGDSYKGSYTNATGHSYKTAVTAPTCTAGGYTTYTCSGCGHSYQDQLTNPTGHSYKSVVTAPTCTALGYTTYTCSVCGDQYTGDQVAAKGHSFSDSSCTVCGEANPDYVDPNADYYLFGYINGTNYACEEDAANTGTYKFTNGKLTTRFDQDSYVAVKTGDNRAWYMTEGWQGTDVTSVTLYNTNNLFSADKLFVPGGKDVTFTLINNGDGSLTLSYEEAVSVSQPTISLKYPTLVFEDVIMMNVYFAASDLGDVTEMGLVTYTQSVASADVNTANAVVPGYTWSEADGLYYATTNGIAAKDLGDELYFAVYAKLADGTYYYTRVVSYSPKTYAYASLSSGSASMRPIVVAMLNYGSAAQTYFNYKTDSLVNANLTDEQKALVEDYRSDMITAVSSPSAAKQGTLVSNGGFSRRYPTVSFEGAFCINYYCIPSAAVKGNMTLYYWDQAAYDANSVLTTGNATAAIPMVLDAATGEYQAAVEGIAAKDLSRGVYVAFVYSDGTTTYSSGVLAYSIGTYCSTQATGTGTAADLAKATAVYGYYANELFNK